MNKDWIPKNRYYFLAVSLPKLQIGEAPDISFEEFERLLKENLSPADFERTKKIRWVYDLENLRRYWLKEPLDKWGNLNENELEDVLLTRPEGVLPLYVYEFLDLYPTLDERLQNFPLLIKRYFQEEAQKETGFISAYAAFERDLRLTLLAFRARRIGRDLAVELQFQDPEDPLIIQLLSQKDAPQFHPPYEFEGVGPLLKEYYNAPMELQKALTEYRFEKIEDLVNFDEFSIDRILAYMIQYIQVDKWQTYNKEQGRKILDSLVEELK